MINEACFDLMIFAAVGIIFVCHSSSCSFSECIFCYTPGNLLRSSFVSSLSLLFLFVRVDGWIARREGVCGQWRVGCVSSGGRGGSGFDRCMLYLRCTIRPLLLMVYGLVFVARSLT